MSDELFKFATLGSCEGGGEAQPFYDAAEFEKAKGRAGGIKNWIEEQLAGTSVTVVLFGAQTFDREWVRHEILRSHQLGRGMLAIDIHNVRDPQLGVDVQGKNPLAYWYDEVGGRRTYLSDQYACYDWVRDHGYDNIGFWIESAARSAGK